MHENIIYLRYVSFYVVNVWRCFLRISIRQSLIRHTFNTLLIRRHSIAMTLLIRYTEQVVYLAYV